MLSKLFKMLTFQGILSYGPLLKNALSFEHLQFMIQVAIEWPNILGPSHQKWMKRK